MGKAWHHNLQMIDRGFHSCRIPRAVIPRGTMDGYERSHLQSGHAAGNGLTPVVKWLLLCNIAVYFVDLLVFDHAIREWGKFTVASGVLQGKVWELLSFQFLHGSVGHLLFNSIALYFFGPWMERWWGAARFLGFYLLCGVAGALFFALLMAAGLLERAVEAGMVGASAGIYGILIGVAAIAPALQVRLLLPPVTLTMRQLAIAILSISVGAILLRVGGNEGGEAGHLGGAIVGFLLVRNPSALRWIGAGAESVPRDKRRPRQMPVKLRPRTHVRIDDDNEVDRILDKISRDGFQALTDQERETLRKAAESQSSGS